MKTHDECKAEVARKYGLGTTLVTGHRSKYWEEACELYTEQFKESIQKCYSEIWKTQIYPLSMKSKAKADDILKREFPFLKPQ